MTKEVVIILLALLEVGMFAIIMVGYVRRGKASTKLRIAQSVSMVGILLLAFYWVSQNLIVPIVIPFFDFWNYTEFESMVPQ